MNTREKSMSITGRELNNDVPLQNLQRGPTIRVGEVGTRYFDNPLLKGLTMSTAWMQEFKGRRT